MRTSSLEGTQTITKSKAPMQSLLNDIAKNGVKEPINYVKSGGRNYIVDGHHRFYSAQKLGIKNVPVQRATLPFKGYKSVTDLVKEGRQPGYWQHMKAKK
ncbi:ParB-like nuclease domain-containing protein [Myroides guanonis]|uniref:ParB-like nuclease domain-containing protein n=2 Tax=Myroides guanonis TaxID=1150112 RepID=A0A1I3MYJ9_9FLAO|nr:ParB-like nuclease domain-containing protein [Myroides guanonis]